MKSYKKGLITISISLMLAGVLAFEWSSYMNNKLYDLTIANEKKVEEQKVLKKDLELTKKELEEAKINYDKFRKLYEEEIKPVAFNK